MNEFDQKVLKKYIKDRIYEFIYDRGATFYPSMQSFETQLDRELFMRDLKTCGKDIRVLFTMFGDRQYMSLHLIGELSNSRYDLKIEEREILQLLRSSKIESIIDIKN